MCMNEILMELYRKHLSRHVNLFSWWNITIIQSGLSFQQSNAIIYSALFSKNEELNSYMKQREEIGVELYGVQQELARQQLALDKLHDKYNEKTQIKLHWEMKLGETKTLHKQLQNDLTLQRKKGRSQTIWLRKK